MPRFLGRGGGVLSYKRLMGMCRWMGSHFHDLIAYYGVALSIESYYEVVHFLILGIRQFFIFTVSKRSRMFVL